MAGESRYARPEIERRFLLDVLPPEADEPRLIRDRYLVGTGLRLRTIESEGGGIVRKLGHKTRAESDQPLVVMHTSLYLSESEFRLIDALPGLELIKTRYSYAPIPGASVDVHHSPNPGLVLLEVNFGSVDAAVSFDEPPVSIEDVTFDERYTGAGLAAGSPT